MRAAVIEGANVSGCQIFIHTDAHCVFVVVSSSTAMEIKCWMTS